MSAVLKRRRSERLIGHGLKRKNRVEVNRHPGILAHLIYSENRAERFMHRMAFVFRQCADEFAKMIFRFREIHSAILLGSARGRG